MMLFSWQKVALLAEKQVTVNQFLVYFHSLKKKCQYCVLIHIAWKKSTQDENTHTTQIKTTFEVPNISGLGKEKQHTVHSLLHQMSLLQSSSRVNKKKVQLQHSHFIAIKLIKKGVLWTQYAMAIFKCAGYIVSNGRINVNEASNHGPPSSTIPELLGVTEDNQREPHGFGRAQLV